MEQISDVAVKENLPVKPTENLTSDDSHPRDTDSIHQPSDGTHFASMVRSEDASFKREDDVGDNDKSFTTSCQSPNESQDDSLTDEYHYLKTGEYTSEIYKVVVRNIPRGISYGVSFHKMLKDSLIMNCLKLFKVFDKWPCVKYSETLK